MARRSRMHRTRSGKRLELTGRDIELFKLLRHYRYLRSTYLHAFVGGASETRFKERLGDLFHEGYLGRPTQQWEFADARCRPVVHEIGAGGSRALREAGAETEAATFLRSTAHRQYRHSLMICEVLASIELGCREKGLRFISWPEIIRKAPETTRASAMAWRLPIPSGGGYLVPDGVLGIEYQWDGTKSYRFFALEADRGTMPISRATRGQTSYLAKLASYGEIIARGVHRAHWGVPNLLVLTLTTGSSRLADVLRKGSEAGIGPAFLFKAVEETALTKPLPALLTEPWQRAGHPPLSIAESS